MFFEGLFGQGGPQVVRHGFTGFQAVGRLAVVGLVLTSAGFTDQKHVLGLGAALLRRGQRMTLGGQFQAAVLQPQWGLAVHGQDRHVAGQCCLTAQLQSLVTDGGAGGVDEADVTGPQLRHQALAHIFFDARQPLTRSGHQAEAGAFNAIQAHRLFGGKHHFNGHHA